MSNPPNWQNADERGAKLEASLNATRESLSILQQRFGDLTRDSKENTVTRPSVIMMLALTASIIATGAVVFYQEILPPAIDRGISDSKSLAKRFDNTDQRFKDINITLNEIRSDIKSLADAKFLSAALKDATSGNETTLVRRLPDANRLLHQVRSMGVLLSAKEYKDISKPLLNHYSSAKVPLKEQLWETLVGFANARSSTDAIARPLSQSEIDKARTAGMYFEAVEVDLSSASSWEGAIFRACKIRISKPENELSLKDVRFVECDFNSMAENESSRKLLSTFLSNDSSKVTGTLASFTVLTPVYKRHK